MTLQLEPTPAIADSLADAVETPGFWSRLVHQRFVRRFVHRKAAMVGLGFLVLIGLVAIFAPWIAPHDPDQQNLTSTFLPPLSEGHLLGTDNLGRDTLSRLVSASRIAVVASGETVLVALLLGVVPGMVAGYLRGRVDWVMSRVADAVQSLPPLILAIAIVAALGPGLRNAMLALGIIFAPNFFRLTRAAVLEVREETYIEASRSIGTPIGRILLSRVTPNILPVLLVQISLVAGFALIAEASLSLLGLGVQPPQASWGSMMGQGYNFLGLQPWLVVWPGLAISFTVLACNVVGDGLRDSIGKEIRVQR
ncbi:MAG: ABC transporter permease [Ilumatobacteraceae bacterium]